MNADEWYALGEKFRQFLQNGVASSGVAGNQAQAAGTASAYPNRGRYGPDPARSAGIFGSFNQAASLKGGHLLVVHLANNAVYQVNPEGGEAEFLFSIGHAQFPFLWRVIADENHNIFCTVSGMRDQSSPTQDAAFGLAGALIKVDTRLADIQAIATGNRLVDPCGMQLLPDGQVLISDFGGFGTAGSLYTLNRVSGVAQNLADGGLLREPVSAFRDGSGMIWVANSYMHYQYPQRGGVLEKDDGEVLRISPDGEQTIALPRQSPANGSVVGIHPSHSDDHVIVVKGDWPTMQTGAVLLLDKKSGNTETLLAASAKEPRFFSTHVCVDGKILWVGESYNKQLLGYDLESGQIVKTIDLSGIMGAYVGVASSFEGIESVSLIPVKQGG